jgi:adenine deaminase
MSASILKATIAGVLLAIASSAFISAQQSAPDLILTNGKIITVDERFTIAQAIAVRGERIVAVGTMPTCPGSLRPMRGASISEADPSFLG